MIAADTSTMSAFLKGLAGSDIEKLDTALSNNQVMLPPVVLTELLSAPGMSLQLSQLLLQVPLLEIDNKYWVRVAALRRAILSKGLKSRLGDACIAQSCLDYKIPLLTRDTDFRHYPRLQVIC